MSTVTVWDHELEQQKKILSASTTLDTIRLVAIANKLLEVAIACRKQDDKERGDSAALLKQLICGTIPHDAPVRTERVGKHLEWVIGIGKDHSAFITMTDEAFRALA